MTRVCDCKINSIYVFFVLFDVVCNQLSFLDAIKQNLMIKLTSVFSLPSLTPSEGYGSWPIGPFFDKWFMKFSSRPGVDGVPALLTIVLKIKHNI